MIHTFKETKSPSDICISRSLLFTILILPLKIPLLGVGQVLDLEIRKQNKPRITLWFNIVYEVHKYLSISIVLQLSKQRKPCFSLDDHAHVGRLQT